MSEDGKRHYQEFLHLAPNAIGDTLAGIFASLAFIWIVVTVFLQSAELAEQRKELVLTRKEFELARDVQQKQLEVIQKQADIFVSEERSRNEARQEKLLDQRLQTLAESMNYEALAQSLLGPRNLVDHITVFEGRRNDESTDAYVLRSSDAVIHFYEKYRDEYDFADHPMRGSIKYYTNTLTALERILELSDLLGPDQQERLRRLRTLELHVTLKDFVADDIWHDEAHMPREFER